MANVGVMGRIFQRKPVEMIHAETDHTELKRTLGALNLVLLGIGCIIGTGIFVLTGRAAAVWAGPGIMISFVITGLLCAFVALCYAELASALPVSGSAYSYSYALDGRDRRLDHGVAAAARSTGWRRPTVAVGWSGYVNSLLLDMHVVIPPELTARAGGGGRAERRSAYVIAHGAINLPALIGDLVRSPACLIVGRFLRSATVNNVIVFIKLRGRVIAFIAIGAFYVHPHLWSPLVPAQVPAPPPGTPMDMRSSDRAGALFTDVLDQQLQRRSHYGLGGVIHGAAVIFFAYIGFEAVSTAGAGGRRTPAATACRSALSARW